MARNKVVVKRKMTMLTVTLALSFVMLIVSLICLFIPFVSGYTGIKNIIYLVAGGAGTVYFAFMTSRLLFSRMMKQTALVITEKGIYDYTVCGIGAGLIERSSITSIKVMGSADKPMLGIVINDPRPIYLKAKKKVVEEMKLNVEAGLPTILIYTKDVAMPIRELAKKIQEVMNGEWHGNEQPAPKPQYNAGDVKSNLEKKGIKPIDDEEDLASEENVESGNNDGTV